LSISASLSEGRHRDALLLTRDHAEVHNLFKQYEKLADAEAGGADRAGETPERPPDE
jgi:hypothetical protein